MNDDHNNYEGDDFPEADEVLETSGQYNPPIQNPDNSNQARHSQSYCSKLWKLISSFQKTKNGGTR